MSEKIVIGMDIGGTSIKSALVTSSGKIVDNFIQLTPVDSHGDQQTILASFVEPMKNLFARARERNLKIQGIGIGMPGPLDAEAGIPLIKGVDKYESIYGVDLRREFRQRLHLPSDFPIYFEIDAWSFVRGEIWQGAAKSFRRVIGVTLGTGLGSAFFIGDEAVDSGNGVPELAWIGGLKYNEGILDDRVSRRGILRRYFEIKGSREDKIDVREIAQRALHGETEAITVFRETGEILGTAARTCVQEFSAECFIVGGQIARSFGLFALPLKQALNISIPVIQAKGIETSGVLGAAKLFFVKENKSRK
ncbi:MAG: ROK family protein [Calditrichaeota bacterium]|nr:ROK family protein [Calditrichota bacterium]